MLLSESVLFVQLLGHDAQEDAVCALANLREITY